MPLFFTVSESGKPPARIILPTGAGESTRHAAERLRDAARRVAGIELPITSEASGTGPRILLGTLAENAESEKLLRDSRIIVRLEDREQEANKRALVPENLGPEGFVIWMHPDSTSAALVLTAATPIGALYAVETLCHRLYRSTDRLIAGPLHSETTPVLNLPAFRVRGIATNLGGPDWIAGGQWEKEWGLPQGQGYDWRGFVDWMASHKINNLNAWLFNLAFGLAYDSKRFPDLVNRHHPNVRHEFMSDLINYAHQRGIHVVANLDFPDNWTAIVKARPELAGKNCDVSTIPSGEAWDRYQEYGEKRIGDQGPEKVRHSCSWVCGSELKVMDLWRAYLEELLDRYPQLDGLGMQLSETARLVCNCSRCNGNARQFAINEEFFAAMVEIGRKRNPAMTFSVYDSWGTRDVLLHSSRYPNFVDIDWSGDLASLFYKRYIPRSTWYLFHKGAERFPDAAYKYAAMALNERGLKAMQIRGAAYREFDNAYQAFEEFSWNPRLSIEDYAALYARIAQRREDESLAALYTAFLNFMLYRDLAGVPAAGARLSPDQERGNRARTEVERLLETAGSGSGLVDAIRVRLSTRR